VRDRDKIILKSGKVHRENRVPFRYGVTLLQRQFRSSDLAHD
jgi:hypothetical protein